MASFFFEISARIGAKISENISDFAEQQEKLRARLASQFTASEGRIAVLKSTQDMLKNQIDAWNNSGN